MPGSLHPWLRDVLACPRDRGPLAESGGDLACPSGHRYPIVHGIPVLLLDELDPTHPVQRQSLEQAASGLADESPEGGIHPFVQNVIGGTNGPMYAHLIGKMREYPIPELRMPPGDGRTFLDIGCNWGRWCVAAARASWRPIGIDPSLRGVLAGQHVARQLGIDAAFVCGDGRALPFRDGVFDAAHSFSVLQHLSKANVRRTLRETRRVLRPGGDCLVQMAATGGLRSRWHQWRRGDRPPAGFDVRYWSVGELERVFGRLVGPSRVVVDGFLSLNAQRADLRFLPWKFRQVVRVSDALRAVSRRVPGLVRWADSVHVHSTRR